MKIIFRKVKTDEFLVKASRRQSQWIEQLADRNGIELDQLPIRIQQIPTKPESIIQWQRDPKALYVVNSQDASKFHLMHGEELREAIVADEVVVEVPDDEEYFAVTVESITSAQQERLFTVVKDPADPSGVRDIPFVATDLPVDDQRDVAVIIHGWSSRSERNFEALKLALLERGDYAKVFAYSYPSLLQTTQESGDAFYHLLKQDGLFSLVGKVDLFAHSLGGLVARKALQDYQEMADRVRRLVTAGTPHLGTPLARAGSVLGIDRILEEFGKFLVRAHGEVSDENATELTGFLYALESFNDHPSSLRDMAPGSPFLRDLNARRTLVAERILVAATYTDDQRSLRTLLFFDGKKNDGIVPFDSANNIPLSPFEVAEMALGNHSSYYADQAQVSRIVQVLLDAAMKR